MSESSKRKTKDFLAIAHEFQLGSLPTESQHPLTKDLSRLAKNNIPEALRILKNIELGVIERVAEKYSEIQELHLAIQSTLSQGNRIFVYGCGATGRLALSLEYLWRQQKPANERDSVVGFMSGGDLALIHSIESFEDHPEWGARQVREVGFGEGDLLIACTEGGETPSVIGAVEEATQISKRNPWFLYCNPDHFLIPFERSRRVIENPSIKKMNLFVGPMSLSGSTRLQATTALMLAVGTALFSEVDLVYHRSWLEKTNINFLTYFSNAESDAYLQNELMLYKTEHYAITIMTDTTERSPTFSLPGFENLQNEKPIPALCYVCLPNCTNSKEAWQKLLLREPRTLEWPELGGVASYQRLLGFDFSQNAELHRKQFHKKQSSFAIDRKDRNLIFQLQPYNQSLDLEQLHPLSEHLILKFFLNAHSTIVMGRLNRFESNVMTWVKPSNNKLIDRAIRYIQYLLQEHHSRSFSYGEITEEMFELIETLGADEAIVMKTFNRLIGR